MQIVITINEDGKASTATVPQADNVVSTDNAVSAAGAFDGGSSPSNVEDMPVEVVTEIPPQPTDVTLNGGSA